jgi:hypothetical protein
MDGPVVGEEGVGDPVEPGTGIAVEEGDGLIGSARARASRWCRGV